MSCATKGKAKFLRKCSTAGSHEEKEIDAHEMAPFLSAPLPTGFPILDLPNITAQPVENEMARHWVVVQFEKTFLGISECLCESV